MGFVLISAVLGMGCGFIEIESEPGAAYTGTTSGSAGDDDVDTSCDLSEEPSPIEGPDCVTAELSCGDRIDATTEGGLQEIDGPALQSWFCTIAGDNDYLGPERVYAFVHPGDSSEVSVRLEEPCGGLELFVMGWASDDCPTEGVGVLQCDEAAGTGEVRIWDNEPRRYLVIVDGADAALPFSLTLSCP